MSPLHTPPTLIPDEPHLLQGRSTTAPIKSHHHRPNIQSRQSHHREKYVPQSAVPSGKTIDHLLSPISRVTSRIPNTSANASRNELIRVFDVESPDDEERDDLKMEQGKARERTRRDEVSMFRSRRRTNAQYVTITTRHRLRGLPLALMRGSLSGT